MSDVTIDQIIQLAAQLSPAERAALVQRLQAVFPESQQVTRESILAEHARRVAAGEFKHVESLYGRYAKPGIDLSFEDIEGWCKSRGR